MMSQCHSSTKNTECTLNACKRKAGNDMTSHTQMEYTDTQMSTINPHIAKAYRTNIHYGSRYAVTSVGDAMKKAEECYLKDLYVQVGLEKDRF